MTFMMFSFSEHAINPGFKDEVLADAPRIPVRGSYGLPSLHCGSGLWFVDKDRFSSRVQRLVERKFNTNFSYIRLQFSFRVARRSLAM